MKTRSAGLLRSALEHGELTRDDVTAHLGITASDLDKTIDGSSVMPLKDQVSLATLLIERVPRLARQARTLQAQAAAAKAFHEKATKSHSHAPMTWRSVR